MLFQACALILSLILIAFLIYKGLSPILSVVIGCSLMIWTNGMDYVATFQSALSTWGSVLMPAVFVTLFGAAMGVLYTKAGAIDSLAVWLLKPTQRVKNEDARIILSILLFIVFRIILGLAGFVNDAVMVTMFAVGAVVFRQADIDRRHLNAVLVIAGTIGLVLPGAPTQTNVMFALYLPEYSPTAYFLPRLMLMLLYIVLVCLIMLRYVKKDRAAGRHFEQRRMMLTETNRELPPVWLCFLPIVVVIITYTFLGIEAWVSITFGLIATMICLYRYFPQEEGKSHFASMIHYTNDGVLLIPLQFMLMVLPTMVMSLSPAFQWGIDALAESGINPYVSFAVLAVILVSFSGAGAIPTICTVAVSGYIGQSMSMYACVIIATWACTVFDSLPTNAAIVIQTELCDCPMKKAYPTIFTTTIVATGIITILATMAAAVGVFG